MWRRSHNGIVRQPKMSSHLYFLSNFFCSEIWGEDSRCIESSTGEGRCYRTACVKDIMAAKINVRGEWLTCTYDFESLETRVGAGLLAQTIVCPRLSSVCPDLFACPFNCAGR